VVPCVYNAASDMLALRSRFLDTRSFSNIDRKFALGPVAGVFQHDEESTSKAIKSWGK
jgi:hypothetical protein